MIDASARSFRFLILTLNCLLTFGSYYVFDMPSVLEDEIKDRLKINSTEFGLFYSLYGWTNCIMSLCAGYIVDRFGYRMSAFLFLGMVVLGQLVFALGGSLDINPRSSFYIMLTGRFIFGIGGGSITIVQNTISAHYFRGKELSVAFGVTLTMSRIGSVLNFFTSKQLCDSTSFGFTLWFGAGCCCVGVVSAIILSMLDKMAERQLGGKYTGSGKVVNFSDVKKFESRYWLLVFTICSFYLCIFPFIATAPDMFKHKRHYDNSKTPSYLASVVYFSSIMLAIPMGRIVDLFGRQSLWLLFGACLTPPVFLMFALTDIYPLWPMLVLGVAYSVMAASLWPSIPLVIPLGTVGTAMGIATSVQMIGVGVTSLVAGVVQDSRFHWKGSNLMFAFIGCVVVGFAVLLGAVDKRKDGILSKSKADRLAAAEASKIAARDTTNDQETPLLENVPDEDEDRK
eukprot:c10101_g8_i1.p1 GENE.c10101_g8_i1~~c10101_g8_i1.p1  ORF type:complete len:455 (+),score=103.28 c10101_g8_i1:47-1411(+)